MNSRAKFYEDANKKRKELGLEPVLMSVFSTDAPNVESQTPGGLPNYDGPSERLRIQAMIYHPELYEKMNLHPTVRAQDQKYLASNGANPPMMEVVDI